MIAELFRGDNSPSTAQPRQRDRRTTGIGRFWSPLRGEQVRSDRVDRGHAATSSASAPGDAASLRCTANADA